MIKVVQKVTRMHHRQCRFKKNSGGGPPNPPKKVNLLKMTLGLSHACIPPALTMCPEQHLSPLMLDSVCSGLMLSMMFVFLSIQDTLSQYSSPKHNSKALIFLLSCFLIVHVSAPYRTIGNTKTFTSFTFVSSVKYSSVLPY